MSHTNGSGQAVTNEAFFAFTGREWDADGDLYFYRTHWYDPGIGWFMSTVPQNGPLSQPCETGELDSGASDCPLIEVP